MERGLNSFGSLHQTIEWRQHKGQPDVAYERLLKAKVSGLPVVDAHGALLTNISLTDLRSPAVQVFEFSFRNVADFLRCVRRSDLPKSVTIPPLYVACDHVALTTVSIACSL